MAEVLKTAVIAAKWWSNKIGDTANLDNYNTGNDFMALLNALTAISLSPTPEATNCFQETLQGILMRELLNNPEHRSVTLKCDCYPDSLLEEAATKSGIDCKVFPLERTMRVTKDYVIVSDGKGKPFHKLTA